MSRGTGFKGELARTQAVLGGSWDLVSKAISTSTVAISSDKYIVTVLR